MGRLQPGDAIQVMVAADWAEEIEALAQQLNCSYGEAIAHRLRQTAAPAASPRVEQELQELRDRLGKLESDRHLPIELAVLRDRLNRLEQSILRWAASGWSPELPRDPGMMSAIANAGDDDDDYEDEPDEILYDFLDLSQPRSDG
ncbi:MAG: hypothetical protein EA367_19290 [Leptolyngbya sp. DLM2.Bin15]|nr:MAG: hypothetical protein EA367_19290 [Leptolyngbya sp. DLM2.Bin15]